MLLQFIYLLVSFSERWYTVLLNCFFLTQEKKDHLFSESAILLEDFLA